MQDDVETSNVERSAQKLPLYPYTSSMGKRGPASSHPLGFGHTTKQGYHRVWDAKQDRLRLHHVMVWEKANGPVPDGMQIHHRNEDPQDNRLENLQCVDALTHRRIHSGCSLDDQGIWHKTCKACTRRLPVTDKHWYFYKGHVRHKCRPCHLDVMKQHRAKQRELANA